MTRTALAARPVVFAPEPEAESVDSARSRDAGWYTDPECRAAKRFWDGSAWTEHTRGPAPLHTIAAATRGGSTEYRCFRAFENRPAKRALQVGLVSLVLNPLLIPSAVAVVLGMRGVRRSRQSPVREGHRPAVAGIALAVAGIALNAAAVSIVLPAVLQHTETVRVHDVRAAVTAEAAQQGVRFAHLACPAPPAVVGATFVCRAATAQHDRVIVTVRVGPGFGPVLVGERPDLPARPSTKHAHTHKA